MENILNSKQIINKKYNSFEKYEDELEFHLQFSFFKLCTSKYNYDTLLPLLNCLNIDIKIQEDSCEF